MRNAIKQAPALTPARSVVESLTDAMFLPMHGAQIASTNITGITTGYPTIIKYGSTILPMAGQTMKIASCTPATYNGYHTVLWAAGGGVAIDLDSSALGAWSSGGAGTFVSLRDLTGNNGPFDVSGTTTGIWAAPTAGLTPNPTGGNWVAPFTSNALLELTGYTGKLLIAFDFTLGAITTGTETVLGINLVGQSGTNTKHGGLFVGIYGAGQNPGLVYRPATAADGAGINTTVQTGAMSATTAHLAWIVDFSGAAPVIRGYKNGTAIASATADMTNATGHPSLANLGAGILCGVDGTAAATGKLGSAGSGAVVQNLLIQKSTESIATLVNRIRKLSALKEYRA